MPGAPRVQAATQLCSRKRSREKCASKVIGRDDLCVRLECEHAKFLRLVTEKINFQGRNKFDSYRHTSALLETTAVTEVSRPTTDRLTFRVDLKLNESNACSAKDLCLSL